mmetsp:Transcript_31410/g.45806  ORF Transcript_31410/g.45806 Transcript_31410/m.45806 type:complete len:125 (-) Transcript_31410:503-877(-)
MKKNTTAVSASSSKLNVSRSSVESNELCSTTTTLAERFQKLNWILNDNAAGPLPPPWNQHQCANSVSNSNSNSYANTKWRSTRRNSVSSGAEENATASHWKVGTNGGIASTANNTRTMAASSSS